MTLTAANFTYPTGVFKANMFPEETLADTLAAFITVATSVSDDEAIQRAYVHYRGYAAICDRLNSGLIREKRLNSEGWIDPSQLKYFERERDKWKLEYEALSGIGGGMAWGAVDYVVT